ncbi:MAG: alpha/beta hydrolase [Anaerolineae bacterium]
MGADTFSSPWRRGKSVTISSTERKIRAGLPIVRFMQSYIPLRVAHWILKQGMARVLLDADVIREAVSADGVSCEWLIPQNSSTEHVLLYLHGGGFVFGLTPQHLQMGAYLAQKMAMRILMVDYRTAPDFPFPAALDDCVTAYLWLLNQGIGAQNIVVAGDSAGGNLTITMLMKLRDSGNLLPAAAACLSPVTDLTPRDSQRKGFKDPLLSPKMVKFYNQSYVGNNDAHNPLISPVFGDLRGLPPLLVHAGQDEILRDDAMRIASLAESVDVDVRLEIYPRMWHVWQINLTLPQAIQSLDDIAQFLKAHLATDA